MRPRLLSLDVFRDGWFVPLASPRNASLLWAVANLVVRFGILALMYRRRIFIKV